MNAVPMPSERRNDVNTALMHLIEELTGQVHEMREEIRAHRETLDVQREALIAKLLAESFPHGDHEAHRKYHERLIKADEERIAFWKKMREELTKWGLIGFFGWFAVFAGHAFLDFIIAAIKARP